MMNKIYPLEWFDSLISQTLNPNNTILESLLPQDFKIISEHIEKESKIIQISLKKEIFLLRRKREVRLQVRKYHSNLVSFIDTVIDYQKRCSFVCRELVNVLDLLQNKLEELLLLIENRFSEYLSLDERVPITYLMLSRNELESKFKILSDKVFNGLENNIIRIVLENGFRFLKSFSGKKITYRQLLYQKELLKSIKNIDINEQTSLFSDIDKVLIGRNFNSTEYIEHIIEQISKELEDEESLALRINRLLYYQKEFDRIHSDERISFDPSRSNIKCALESWFKQEINYLERNLKIAFQTNNEVDASINSLTVSDSKIECDLSADQIALILRAADESRIVKARSMNHFFKMIVPYLSTPFKRELSYQSVRSKSYNAEDRDKFIAVQTLEKIIKKINSY
ncbi:hypothetical protein [Flavobacterium ginsenosidimutans]|uniref:hypothetical protein n=1 Tax=Flavobacterium ginsenosidimutans TaxID=687844 RepID=UPI003D96D3E5